MKAKKKIVLGQRDPESVVRTQALLKHRSIEEFADELREGMGEAKKRALESKVESTAVSAVKVHAAG